MCKECGDAVLSSSEPNSSKTDEVHLFLLKEGTVVQTLEGQYDSYGRVFKGTTTDSVHWDMPWSDVCDLMFDKDKGSGLAAVHKRCFTGNVPTTQSDDDPNQGWGEDDADEYDYYDCEDDDCEEDEY